MESRNILSIKRAIRETLNIPDQVQINSFTVSLKDGLMSVTAETNVSIDLNLATEAGKLVAKAHRLVRKYTRRQRSAKPQPKRGKQDYNREFEITKGDFKLMRNLLRTWRKEQLLSPAEVEEMTTYAGKFFSTMSNDDRLSFMAFFNRARATADRIRSMKPSVDHHDNEPAEAEHEPVEV